MTVGELQLSESRSEFVSMVTPANTGDTQPQPSGAEHGAPVSTTESAIDTDLAARGDVQRAAHLFLVVDASEPLGSSSRHCLDGVTAVNVGRGVRGIERSGTTLSLWIPDRRASSQHMLMTMEADGWWIADLGSKNGTLLADVPVSRRKLFDGALIEVGHTFLRFRSALARSQGAPDLVSSAWAPTPGLETLLPDLESTFSELTRMATTPTPLMILGETGTGKDVTARAYHRLTARSGPFIPVNCGALPPSLVEATLFGHRRGSFSGATGDGLGLVRAAEGGTLFLDELGDLPLESQGALLRVIEAREVTPIGSTQAIRVDVRIVAATHRDIPRMVRQGIFRADLLARLSAHVIRLPPLRERMEDLGLLIGATLRVHAPSRAQSIELHRDAARVLLRRRYPLNTRELMNAMGKALTLMSGNVIGPQHLEAENLDISPEALAAAPTATSTSESFLEATPLHAPSPKTNARRAQLELLLSEHHGNVTSVANALGKTRALIYKWLNQLGIDPEAFRR